MFKILKLILDLHRENIMLKRVICEVIIQLQTKHINISPEYENIPEANWLLTTTDEILKLLKKEEAPQSQPD